jgi:RNA polymerase sigma-70 factor (ECF subfamily)
MVSLLSRVADGDKAAYAQLYRMLERPLYGFISLKLNDPAEANDVFHETFIEVWKRAGTFEGRSAVKSWVYGIAYRKVVDVIRKQAKVVVSDEIPEVEDQSADAEASLQAAQSGAHVRYCLGTLKDEQQAVIRLAFFDDLTYREIADIVDAPEGTVKTRVYHAKQALLHCLSRRLSKKDIPA